jgi:hypothetical protein
VPQSLDRRAVPEGRASLGHGSNMGFIASIRPATKRPVA